YRPHMRRLVACQHAIPRNCLNHDAFLKIWCKQPTYRQPALVHPRHRTQPPAATPRLRPSRFADGTEISMIFGTEHELQRDDMTMSKTVQAARAAQLGNLQCIY